MATSRFDVFISYRRESGSELAQLVRTHLERRGFRVFLDVRALGAGHFDDALLNRIAETPDFVLILSANALDRCRQEDDWVRREIAHAIKTSRNLVPIAAPAFQFPQPSELPADLATLPRHQALVYDHRYSDEAFAKLLLMLKSAPAVRARRSRRRLLTAAGVLFFGAAAWVVANQWLPRHGFASGSGALEPLALYWHGFGQRAEAGRWAEFIVQDGATMRSGDQFRVVFSPSADAYAYIVGIDPDQHVDVLFPHAAIGMDNHVRAGEQYQVPDGLNWFTLDERTGTETLYLVASYDPIQDLESLFKPDAATTSPTQVAAQVQERIQRLDGVAATGDAIETERGRVELRGVKITPDRRVASATLTSGQRVSRDMQFQLGGSRVVKRLQFRHDPR